jgi:hypothetical protein
MSMSVDGLVYAHTVPVGPPGRGTMECACVSHVYSSQGLRLRTRVYCICQRRWSDDPPVWSGSDELARVSLQQVPNLYVLHLLLVYTLLAGRPYSSSCFASISCMSVDTCVA